MSYPLLKTAQLKMIFICYVGTSDKGWKKIMEMICEVYFYVCAHSDFIGQAY